MTAKLSENGKLLIPKKTDNLSQFFTDDGLKDRNSYVERIADPAAMAVTKKEYKREYPSGFQRPLGLTEYDYVTPYLRDCLQFGSKAQKIITIPFGIDIEQLFIAPLQTSGRFILSNEDGSGAELVPSYFSFAGFHTPRGGYWVDKMHCTSSACQNITYGLSPYFPVPLFEEIRNIWDVHSFETVFQHFVDDLNQVDCNWKKYQGAIRQGVSAYLDIIPKVKEFNAASFTKVRLQEALDSNSVRIEEYTQDGVYLGDNKLKTRPFATGEKKDYERKLIQINELLELLLPRLKRLEDEFPIVND